jgi:hypothetical protein
MPCLHGMPQLDEWRCSHKENAMSVSTDRPVDRHASYPVDPETSVHELLNDATEWLQYARGLTGLLADLIHEADSVDCRRMALGLEAIGALTHVAVKCTTEAHARLCWKEARTGEGTLG